MDFMPLSSSDCFDTRGIPQRPQALYSHVRKDESVAVSQLHPSYVKEWKKCTYVPKYGGYMKMRFMRHFARVISSHYFGKINTTLYSNVFMLLPSYKVFVSMI